MAEDLQSSVRAAATTLLGTEPQAIARFLAMLDKEQQQSASTFSSISNSGKIEDMISLEYGSNTGATSKTANAASANTAAGGNNKKLTVSRDVSSHVVLQLTLAEQMNASQLSSCERFGAFLQARIVALKASLKKCDR